MRKSQDSSFTVQWNEDTNSNIDVNITGGTEKNLPTQIFNAGHHYSNLGNLRLSILVKSGEVSITGIEYFNDIGDIKCYVQAQHGREIEKTEMSEVLTNIYEQINPGTLVFALGTNDRLKTGTSKDTVLEHLAEFEAKVKEYKWNVIIADFAPEEDENYLKTELRNIANRNYYIKYVNFSKYFTYNPGNLDQISSGVFTDDLHPNEKGEKVIAETLANKLQLDYTTKESIEKENAYSEIVVPKNGWGIYNIVNEIPIYKKQGNLVFVDMNITFPADANLALPITTLDFKPSRNRELYIPINCDDGSGGSIIKSKKLTVDTNGDITLNITAGEHKDSYFYASFTYVL